MKLQKSSIKSVSPIVYIGLSLIAALILGLSFPSVIPRALADGEQNNASVSGISEKVPPSETAETSLRRDDYPNISMTGAGTLHSVEPNGAERFSFEIELKNNKPEKVLIVEESVFLASQGGWSRSLEKWISSKIGGTIIDKSAAYKLKYTSPTEGERTASYVFARLRVRVNGKERVVFHQFPIKAAGLAVPPPIPVSIFNPVYISVQEPVTPLLLSNGKQWFQIVGQVINFTRRPVKIKSWSVKSMHNGEVLSSAFGPDPFDSAKQINEFFVGKEYSYSEKLSYPVRIQADIEIDGISQFITRDVSMSFEKSLHSKAPPVKGLWNWGNGAGDPVFHIHYRNEDQRYAYDMGMYKNVNGKHVLSSGAADKNESYFAWNQPIYALDDGTVISVIDNFPDNNGNVYNKATGQNWIVVEHLLGKRSLYVHIRQNSATVAVGQKVKAGDMLARVGNAGSSGAPHLHLAAYAIGKTGHIYAIPIFFQNINPRAPNINANIWAVPKGTNTDNGSGYVF